MRTGFEAAVAAMPTASIINGVLRGPMWRLSLDPAVLPRIALSVLAGLTLTLVGTVLGAALGRAAEQRPLNWGAGVSLMLMGLNVLGLSVPSAMVIAPLAAGCIATLALAGVGRVRMWRDARRVQVSRPAGAPAMGDLEPKPL